MLLGSVRGGCFMLIVLVHVGFVFSACSALLGAHWHIHLPHIRPPSTLSVKLARVTSIYLAKNAKYTTKNCQVPAHKHGEHDKTSAEWSTWELVNWAAYSSASEGLAISLTAAQTLDVFHWSQVGPNGRCCKMARTYFHVVDDRRQEQKALIMFL